MIGLLVLLAVAAAYAYEHRATPRVSRTGKSGTTWYVETVPGFDPSSVHINVYSAPAGGDLILAYNQVSETGQRFVTYQAPSTLGQTAVSDFI